jgi:hypothetical protein
MEEQWFHSTGARFPSAPCIPSAGALVFGIDTPATNTADAELVMIR